MDDPYRQILDDRRLRYRLLVDQIFEEMGGACTCCGLAAGLEIDHIDPATKSFTITSSLDRRSEEIEAELLKCQLLCRPVSQEKDGE